MFVIRAGMWYKELMKKYDKITRILIWIMGVNWAVAVTKLIFGYLIKSSSMVADGFHSFSDGASNIIGLVGIYIASRPIDKEHPYGHKKYETLMALGIAFLLFIVAFNLLRGGINRFFHPVVPEIGVTAFIIMFITIGANIWVERYEHRKGRELKSDILVADSMHTRADMLTSAAVIISFIGVKFGVPAIDPVVTVVISGFIGYAGFEILKESSSVLCDAAAIDVKEIEQVVRGMDGVVECHKIRTRGRQDDVHLDLHILVRANMHIDKAHSLSYKIENEIKRIFTSVSDVVVHMEPS